jgi:hypothetical protein
MSVRARVKRSGEVVKRPYLNMELYEKLVMYSLKKYGTVLITLALQEAVETFLSIVEGKYILVPADASAQQPPPQPTTISVVEPAKRGHVATSKRKPEDAVAPFIKDNPWVEILSRKVVEAEQAGEA